MTKTESMIGVWLKDFVKYEQQKLIILIDKHTR